MKTNDQRNIRTIETLGLHRHDRHKVRSTTEFTDTSNDRPII